MEYEQKAPGASEPTAFDIRTRALDYFLDFVRWKTTSNEACADCPSSPGQRAFGAHLKDLLAFIAHMDTSPELTGKDVRPRLVRWDGSDLALDADAAFTVDGGGCGELEYESFNAAQAVVDIQDRPAK